MNPLSRAALLCAGLLYGALAPLASSAQNFPSKPITLVVPVQGGSSPDVTARLYAQRLSESLRQPVVVENVPGASGTLGAQKVARSTPDGYTLMFASNNMVTINPHMIANLGYQVERDFAPIIKLTTVHYVWISNPKFPGNTVQEWVEYAKANPGKLTFGTTGPGSAANLAGELFMRDTNTRMLAVAYKGSSLPDLMTDVIQLKQEPTATAVPLIQAGKVKALAVTGATRVALLPNVPRMAESFPSHVIEGSHSVWAPAGTPAAVISLLNAEFEKVGRLTDVIEKLADLGIQTTGSTPAELLESTRKESQMWADLIKTRNIKVE